MNGLAGVRDESDFSCTPAYIVNRYRRGRIYAENMFAGDRNAWTTRNASPGRPAIFCVIGDDTSNTDSSPNGYCRGASFYFSNSLREKYIEKHWRVAGWGEGSGRGDERYDISLEDGVILSLSFFAKSAFFLLFTSLPRAAG